MKVCVYKVMSEYRMETAKWMRVLLMCVFLFVEDSLGKPQNLVSMYVHLVSIHILVKECMNNYHDSSNLSIMINGTYS